MSTPFDPGAQPQDTQPQGIGNPPAGFPPPGAPQPYPQPGYPQPGYPQPGYPYPPQAPYGQMPYGQMPYQGVPPKKPVAKQPWLWIIIGIVVVAIIIVAVVAINGRGNTPGSTSIGATSQATAGQNPGASSDTPGVSLDAGWTFTSDPFLSYVTGYVSNDTDQDLSGFISIEFNEYDSQGAILGTCLDMIQQIDAHGKWKFKAYCIDSDTASVKFKDITIF